MSFCTKCGQSVAPGVRFCTRCGAAQAQSAANAAPASTPPPTIQAVQPRSGLPVLLVVLGVLALVAVLGIGGMVYVGYQVKEKAASIANAVTSSASQPAKGAEGTSPPASDSPASSALFSNLSNVMDGGNDEGDPVEGISINDPITPCTPAPYPSQAAARIPLQAGTVITTTWGMDQGDVETRTSITAVDADSLSQMAVTADYKDAAGGTIPGPTATNSTCNVDFAAANTYTTGTNNYEPHRMHDMTRLRLSDKSFQEIRSSGKTYLVYFDSTDGYAGASRPDREAGLLTRVEPQDVAYPMIVNDQPVTLPTIHLAGVMASIGKDPRPKKDRPTHTEADVYVIDDPADPLVLLLKLKDPVVNNGKFRIEVTKIDFPVPHPVNLLEKQLTEQKRAVTYGIYFDFDKDTLKPEWEPVLKEIVQAMTDNPDWKLTVEGHTDNIGGDAYNLDLSKRRAAAVKDALVTQYHIAADRLSTNGFGSSRPVETNDTLAGRARNRRVELTRE